MGIQPCAAVTLQYTLGSLANITPLQPPILIRYPSSLTQLHVWNGNITAHRLSEKKRRPLFLSLAISSRCSAVKFEIHAWILSSFLKSFFFYETSSQPVLSPSTPTLPYPRVFWFPALLLLIPQNLYLAGVVRLGGNGFSGYQDRRK